MLAADGARSAARGLLGIERRDFEFSERWLVLDVRILEPLPAELLALEAFQVCDPRRPTLLAPLGKRHFRFEWMLFEDETDAEFESPQKGWELIAEWDVVPGQVEFARQVVYAFEAKVATEWRRGRVLLGGDAVHTMPPHVGQGMCSGVRDAALLAGERPPVPKFPQLVAGALRGSGEEGGPPAPAGELFLQAEVERDGRRGLFHDVIGQGFHLVSPVGCPLALLGEEERGVLTAIGATVAVLGGAGEAGFGDPEGSYGDYLADLAAVLVRPDYVVYGAAATAADLPDLIRGLGRDLALTGLEPGA